MATTTDLKFDEQVINVGLAENYLKQHNKEFHSKGYNDSGIIENDICNNKIYLSVYDMEKEITPVLVTNYVEENVLKYMYLGNNISRNTDLFCQLEYMFRKKPIDEVKKLDMKLLEQNLMYQISDSTAEKAYIPEILMTGDTPLASLGCVVQSSSVRVAILSTKETAVICSLFVELCQEVGLNHIDLVFISNPIPRPTQCMALTNIKELHTGCMGIVTEKADIDSAVDTFLYATSQYPWNFKKIYVQECVLSQFKKSLEWKTRNASANIDIQLLTSCTSVHAYDDKLYLFEFAGDVNTISQNSIIIEAYRTTKELLSIMSLNKPFCVSLWSSHVSESNEIAFGLETNILWINDYGYFEGPPITSQAFYSLLHSNIDKERLSILPVSDVSKIREAWAKTEMSTRLINMTKVMNNFKHFFNDVKRFRLNFNNNSNISAGNKLFVSIRYPDNVIVANVATCLEVFDLLDFILEGGGVMFNIDPDSSEKNNIIEICQAFRAIGAPLVVDLTNVGYYVGKMNQLRYKTKAIWSSVGTTFAN